MRRQDPMFCILRELMEDEEYDEKSWASAPSRCCRTALLPAQPEKNYLAGPDDIYVSPNQVRKMGLRTGDGRSKLCAEAANAISRDQADFGQFRGSGPGSPADHSDNLTPLYPEQKLSLDTLDPTVADKSVRVIDIIRRISAR